MGIEKLQDHGFPYFPNARENSCEKMTKKHMGSSTSWTT